MSELLHAYEAMHVLITNQHQSVISTRSAAVSLRMSIVRRCLEYNCSMRIVAIPDVEVSAIRLYTVFLIYSPDGTID